MATARDPNRTANTGSCFQAVVVTVMANPRETVHVLYTLDESSFNAPSHPYIRNWGRLMAPTIRSRGAGSTTAAAPGHRARPRRRHLRVARLDDDHHRGHPLAGGRGGLHDCQDEGATAGATLGDMRRLRVALCLAGLTLAAGCGGEEETGAGLPGGLGYVSRDAGAVMVIPTDLDGISFEDEVLKRFDGPSASVADEAGQFGAVSDVADPDRMRALLPEIAPRVPPILRGLEGLGSEALVALLLFAPDAPLVPGALPLLRSGIDVRRLEGDLYVMSSEVFAGPGTVVFGLIGDRFVVATDRDWAPRAAELEVSEVDDADGAAVGRTDLSTWSGERIELATGFKLQRLGETVAQLEASTEGLEGELRVAVPEGLD